MCSVLIFAFCQVVVEICGILCIMDLQTILIVAGISNFVLLVGHFIVFIYKWGKMNEKVDGIKETADKRDKHGERLAAIESRIGMWGKENISTNSPATLTEKGKGLLKESGAEECVEKNKDILLKEFENISDPFDIQEKSLKVAEQVLRKDKKVKAYLFQKGEKGVGEVAEVAAIALRDIVLKHKGIDV